MKKTLTISLLIFALLLGTIGVPEAFATPTATAQSKSTAKKKSSTKSKTTSKKKSKSSKSTKSSGKRSQSSSKKSSKPRTAAEVKKAREQNTAAMRNTRSKIKLNTQETEQRLNQLNLLEGEISNCNVNIAALNHNIDSVNRAIGVATDSINALDNRLATITDSYVKAVRKTQGTRRNTSQLAFIFSSKSFNQAYRRMRSLKQFAKWRKHRADEITLLRGELDKRKTALGQLKASATASLGKLNNEKALLVKKQGETSQLVDRLKTEGAELNAIMNRRQREAKALDAELDRIIAEEAARQERLRREKEEAERRAAEEARRKAEAEAAAAAEAEAARLAAIEAQKAKAAEQAAQARAAEAEKKARETADKEAKKLAEKKAKEERKAAKKAEKERVKAEREAAKRKAEAEKQLAQAKARAGKPVKHKGKNNIPSSSASTSTARLSTPTAANAPSGVASKTIETDLGSDFEKAKGRLPYPVSGRYTIVKRFGRQKHPTLPHVETNNSGIDMQTEPGAPVRSVFNGEVSAVFRPDGYNTVVVIRHGKFMTVYANLGAISVSNGQKVKTGQTIGTVFTDAGDANRSVLHFEIRNQRLKENPELWLRH